VPVELTDSGELIPCEILNAWRKAGSRASFSGHVFFGRSSTPRTESAASGVAKPRSPTAAATVENSGLGASSAVQTRTTLRAELMADASSASGFADGFSGSTGVS